MKLLVDANVLIDAARVGLVDVLVRAADHAPWWVTHEVYDELVQPPGLRAQVSSRRRLDALRNLWGRKLGMGEASCIVCAQTDPAFTFVTWDNGALLVGVYELQGRVVSGHQWLAMFVTAGALTWSQAHAVAAACRVGQLGRRHPSWWPATT